MQVKGTAVKSINEYVEKYHQAHYQAWIDSLPEESKNIHTKSIFVTDWYPMQEAAIIPTIAIGNLFFAGNGIKAAWETGRYSAEIALTGIYKAFVKLSTPKFLMQRASSILPAYYSPSEVKVLDSSKQHITISVDKITLPDPIIEARISGWIQRAMEVCGCKDVKVEPIKSLSKGDKLTELCVSWG